MKTVRGTTRPAALAVALAVAGAVLLPASAATAAPAAGTAGSAAAVEGNDPARQNVEHDLKGPLSERQAAQRQEALERVLSGEATPKERGASSVVKLGSGKYVELAREKTDKIFVILAEFGDQVDSTYGGTPGPAHNEIAEPDRAVNNSTIWQADYDRQTFQDLYFSHDADKESVAKYYEKQSSGRYSVDGEVADWVKVDYNEARYGSNTCDTCVWDLVQDGVNQWVADRQAAGATNAEIKAGLAEYDVWDRYDYDGDGDFNESDGYLDHFQIVHAGEDESAGGGAQGEDAIWAHRWYVFGTDMGSTGPAGNLLGGAEIGDTGIWVGDYTIQPENGGLGVYAHEYGHDLGLPDHYDTTNTQENSSGFWTLMSSGSWLSDGTTDIGSLPGNMSAWDKLQLGWLDYDTAKAATKSTHTLGVAEYNTKNAQALVVELPEKTVTTPVTTPAEGSYQWWSGSGDGLNNTLTRSLDLTGASTADLSLKSWYDIETDYDYLYTEVSTDDGATWATLDGTVNGEPLPRDGSDKPALTGTVDAYSDLAYPLDAYAGQQVGLRFRYTTDGGVAQKGFTADAVTVTADGTAIVSDGAETDDADWTAKGFSRVGESITDDYTQYYIAENRQYVSYDQTLQSGPYNFGWVDTKPDRVEHFPYQNGLLISLWDTSQLDNNVSNHPGQGLILPIDSHAKPLKWSDGSYMRTRIQSYDSPFGRSRTDALTLHRDGIATTVKSQAGQSIFDDHAGTYWYEETPYASVLVPDTNTKIKVMSESGSGSTIKVRVDKSTR